MIRGRLRPYAETPEKSRSGLGEWRENLSVHGASLHKSYRIPTMSRVALGLRVHSGWAALVAVGRVEDAVAVVARRRIALAGPGIPKQPYHAAENLGLEKARERIRLWVSGSRRLAAQAFREVLAALRKDGHEVVGCGLLLASGRPLPPLAAVLASHALIHTADGEHFRAALVHAAGRAKLPVTAVREKEVWREACARRGVPIETLQGEIRALGKSLGPPWTQDQKHAALVAGIALDSERFPARFA
jgi:hypothetical protein